MVPRAGSKVYVCSYLENSFPESPVPLVYRGDTPPTMKNGRECDGDSRPLRVPWRRSGARPLRRTVSGSTVKHSSRRSTQKSLFQRASRSNPGGRAASNSRKLDTYGGTSVKFVCRSNGVLPRQYQDQAQCCGVLCRDMPNPVCQAIFRYQFRLFWCTQTMLRARYLGPLSVWRGE